MASTSADANGVIVIDDEDDEVVQDFKSTPVAKEEDSSASKNAEKPASLAPKPEKKKSHDVPSTQRIKLLLRKRKELEKKLHELEEREVDFDNDEEEAEITEQERMIEKTLVDIENRLFKYGLLNNQLSDDARDLLNAKTSLNVVITDTGCQLLNTKLTSAIADKEKTSKVSGIFLDLEEIRAICREVYSQEKNEGSNKKDTSIPEPESASWDPFIACTATIISKAIRSATVARSEKAWEDYVPEDQKDALNNPPVIIKGLSEVRPACTLDEVAMKMAASQETSPDEGETPDVKHQGISLDDVIEDEDEEDGHDLDEQSEVTAASPIAENEEDDEKDLFDDSQPDPDNATVVISDVEDVDEADSSKVIEDMLEDTLNEVQTNELEDMDRTQAADPSAATAVKESICDDDVVAIVSELIESPLPVVQPAVETTTDDATTIDIEVVEHDKQVTNGSPIVTAEVIVGDKETDVVAKIIDEVQTKDVVVEDEVVKRPQVSSDGDGLTQSVVSSQIQQNQAQIREPGLGLEITPVIPATSAIVESELIVLDDDDDLNTTSPCAPVEGAAKHDDDVVAAGSEPTAPSFHDQKVDIGQTAALSMCPEDGCQVVELDEEPLTEEPSEIVAETVIRVDPDPSHTQVSSSTKRAADVDSTIIMVDLDDGPPCSKRSRQEEQLPAAIVETAVRDSPEQLDPSLPALAPPQCSEAHTEAPIPVHMPSVEQSVAADIARKLAAAARNEQALLMDMDDDPAEEDEDADDEEDLEVVFEKVDPYEQDVGAINTKGNAMVLAWLERYHVSSEQIEVVDLDDDEEEVKNNDVAKGDCKPSEELITIGQSPNSQELVADGGNGSAGGRTSLDCSARATAATSTDSNSRKAQAVAAAGASPSNSDPNTPRPPTSELSVDGTTTTAVVSGTSDSGPVAKKRRVSLSDDAAEVTRATATAVIRTSTPVGDEEGGSDEYLEEERGPARTTTTTIIDDVICID